MCIFKYFVRFYRIVSFLLFFIWEVIIANLKIAYAIITPSCNICPGVIAIPLDTKSDAEIVLVANVITMTPGTLSLDVSTDRKFLFVHSMYIHDIDAFRDEIRLEIVQRIKGALK